MPTSEQTSITFAEPFGWWQLAIGCLVLALLAWQLHRWLIAPLSHRRRGTLIALRVGWSVLLLWCIGQPTLMTVTRIESIVTPKVVVLVDQSASMAIAGEKARSPWAAVQNTADDLQDRLLAAGVTDATWLGFGERLTTYDRAARPDAQQSLVVRNLRDAINQTAGGLSPTVMFVLSDGQDTTQATPAEAIAAAEGKDVRLLPIVPAGLTLSPPPLVRVERLDAPADVSAGSSFDLKADVRLRRPPGDTSPVQVVLERDGEPLTTRSLAATANATVQASFNTRIDKDGQYLYTVRVKDSADRELSSLATVVRASTRNTVRVLYVQGSLDWEYKFVRQAVADNPNITLDGITRLHANAYLRQTTAADPKLTAADSMAAIRAAGSGYDVIVLSNLNPDLLDADLQQSLLDLVQKRGGGMLFFSGNAAQSARFNRTLLEQLLPVTLEHAASAPVATDTRSRQFAEFMRDNGSIANEGPFAREMAGGNQLASSLRAMRMTPEGLGSDIWADTATAGPLQQPPATFLYSAKARRAKPAATVLAVHPTEQGDDRRPRPLFVTQNIASGRSAFLGVDGLWRWRMQSASTARDYDRFWQQLFLWLGGRVQQNRLEFEHGRYPVGATVKARLVMSTPAKPDALPVLFVRHADGSEQKLPATWNPARTIATTELAAGKEGQLQFLARPAAEPSGAPLAVQVVDIRSTNLEQEFCGLNEPLLQQLAKSTRGQVLASGQLDLVSSLVKTTRKAIERTDRKPLWHFPAVFVVMLLLYGTELALRRVYQLT